MSPARRAAHRALVRLEASGARFDDVVRHEPLLNGLDGRDAALAWELVAGVTRRRRSLDALLATFLDFPLERVAPTAVTALRMGAYQLVFLDRVPAHAAVGESVGLIRRRGRRTAGLINAVLRRVADEGRSRFAQLTAGDDLDALGIRLSYPTWLVRRWVNEWGRRRAESLLEAGDRPPERCLRVNSLVAPAAEARRRLEDDGVKASPAPQLASGPCATPDAFVFEGGPIEGSVPFREGLVTPQSRASQLVATVAADGAPAATQVADLCAAPGTKTAQLAALLPAARITAVEVDARRADDLRRTLDRLHVQTATVVEADATTLCDEYDGGFDLVLVDAPCTGLGTVASRPDLRWRRRPGDVERAAVSQRRLLTRAVRLVRPGGVIVYAVCTLETEETVDVIRSVAASEGLVHDDLGASCPTLADGRLATALVTMPDRDRTSGFFIARLRRWS